MCCFVSLLLFKEMQMSMTCFSAIPHLRRIFKPLLKPGTWDIPEHYKTWVSIPVVKLAKKSIHKVFNGEKGGTKKTFC